MITILHQHHIYNGFPKFTRQGHWRIVDETMKVAEKKREIKCRENGKPIQRKGKVPAFYLVLLHILNLVPEAHRHHKFYVSL